MIVCFYKMINSIVLSNQYKYTLCVTGLNTTFNEYQPETCHFLNENQDSIVKTLNNNYV